MPAAGTVLKRSRGRRVLRACAFLLAGLVVLAVVAVAAMIRRDIPIDELVPRYGAAPSQFMELQGMRVHYRDEGAGPPLVLVHGTSSSLHTWDGWVKELAGKRRLIRVDLPGFGLTGPAPDGDYRVERYERFLGEFLDRLGIARADLAGNSLGGRVVLTFALAHPERVHKLVLIDAGGLSGAPHPTIFKLARMPVVGRALLTLTPEFLVRRNVEEVYGDPSRVTDAVVERYHDMALRAGNRKALWGRLNGTLDPDLDARLGDVAVPVLIEWGEQDRWMPVSFAQRFARGIKGAELRIYPGAGHVPMEEIPTPTARDADAFLGTE